MILLINRKRLLSGWTYTSVSNISGVYRDFRWVIYNIRKSSKDQDCLDYDFDIINERSNKILFHATSTTPNKGMYTTLKSMPRRIHRVFYDNTY